MQTHKVSPALQAVSDRAYMYACGIDEAYKHLCKQNGDILNGANDYTITFTPPPVSQFWSVTATAF